MIQGLPAWATWLDAIPAPVAASLLGAGVALLAGFLVANRRPIAAWCGRLPTATTAAFGTFKLTMWPPPPPPNEPSDDTNDADGGWEVLEHTLRRTGLVAGEGSPALIGMAQVTELNGQRRLFLYQFAAANGSHQELRTETAYEPIVRRRAVVKVDGEVLSDTIFDPYATAVVHDVRRHECVQQGAAHLLQTGDRMTVAVTDFVRGLDGEEHEFPRDVLRVPLRGYVAASNRLSRHAMSIFSASV